MKSIMRHFTARDWGATAGAVVLIALSVWLELLMPDYMKDITELLITPGSTVPDILWAGGKMLLCALASLVVSVLVTVISGYLAANYSFNVRAKLYDAVEGFSMAEINRFSTASLITRSTNDITQVQTIIVFGLFVIVRAPLMAVLAISKIADHSSEWTISAGVAVVLVIIILAICFIFAHPLFRRIQTLTDNINRITRENLTGLRVVRAYNAEDYQKNKFEQANKDLTNNNMKAHRIMSIMMPSMMLIMNGMSLVVYWIGAYLIDGAPLMEKGQLFLDMTVFSQYALMVIMAFMMLNMIFIMGPRSLVAAKRINEVIDTKSSVTDGKGVDHTDTVGEIEFKNVSFKYPDAADYVLKDISFTAKKGETVAIQRIHARTAPQQDRLCAPESGTLSRYDQHQYRDGRQRHRGLYAGGRYMCRRDRASKGLYRKLLRRLRAPCRTGRLQPLRRTEAARLYRARRLPQA